MKIHKDSHNTTEWAIATVAGISAVASAQDFMLANRVTGRAHTLYFVGGGLTFGGGFSVGRKLSYKSFRTSKSVNFDDFNGKGARITEINIEVIIGYSRTFLTIFLGSNPLGAKLATITWGGLGVGKVSIKGQAAVHGALAIKYGNGRPMGQIVRVLDMDIPDPIRREPLTAHIKSSPFESPLFRFPDDVLFGFDSSRLKTSAYPLLKKAMEVIESRDGSRIVVEGHTDSVGSVRYNKGLSLRRATAVKNWFIGRHAEGAHGFVVRGWGEEKPIAPNRKLDGTDNEEGRAQNRRVEIRFE